MPEIRHSRIGYSTYFLSFLSIPFFHPHLLIHTFTFNILPFVLRLLIHLMPLLFLLHNNCLFPFLSLLLAYLFCCLHPGFYPILSLLFLPLLTFDFHTFTSILYFPFFVFCFLLPFSFFVCAFLSSSLRTAVLDVNALFCLLVEVSMCSVTAPVVAATRKPCSCQNGGMCHLKRRACHCLPGYFGRRCERVSCKPGCLNGGHCREPDQCVCPPHYSGPRCETRECSTSK